ncbi:hypothetical protein MOOR_27070 [Moorella thermoacetica]|uniref:Competence protein A n=1 Tax=Neomoorella thermoacetica TaxID=1525 RepID=A0A1J5JSY2_NEOTH|nr:hypothetical protein [Moorella thermoacetica]OIQ07679.1 hypothetical protein MOOR_27070 [Moorella thermoacetica]
MLLNRHGFRCVGLDLEGPAIRAVLVHYRKNEITILGKAERPWPGQQPADLSREVADLLVELKARDVPVVVGVGGEGTFVRSLRLPDIPVREIDEAVRWELDVLLPKEDPESKYIIKHAVTGKKGEQLYVLAVAAAEEPLRQQLSLLAHQIPLAAADLRVCALWRAAMYMRARPEEGALAVVEALPSGLRVVIGEDNLQFARELPPETELILELRRTLNFYQSQYSTRVRRLLTSGSLVIPNLGIEEAAVMGEAPGQPWFGERSQPWGPEYAVALGLALYYFEEPRVDLLPADLKSKHRTPLAPRSRPILAAVAAGLFCLAILPGMTIYYRTAGRAMENELAALTPRVQEEQRIVAERRRLEEWLDVVQSFNLALPSRANIIEQATALPADTWLTSLEMIPAEQTASSPSSTTSGSTPQPAAKSNGGGKLPAIPDKILFQGYSLTATPVGVFRDKLASLPFFSGVIIKNIEWDAGLGAYKFALEAQLQTGGR